VQAPQAPLFTQLHSASISISNITIISSTSSMSVMRVRAFQFVCWPVPLSLQSSARPSLAMAAQTDAGAPGSATKKARKQSPMVLEAKASLIVSSLEDMHRESTLKMIDKHLRENPAQISSVWNMLDTGMLNGRGISGTHDVIPTSSSKLGLLSQETLCQIVTSLCPRFDKALLSKLKVVDKKVAWKLFAFGLAASMSERTFSHSKVELARCLMRRYKNLGSRLAKLKIADDAIDWQTQGVYSFVFTTDQRPKLRHISGEEVICRKCTTVSASFHN
jgi:hypothetical protein